MTEFFLGRYKNKSVQALVNFRNSEVNWQPVIDAATVSLIKTRDIRFRHAELFYNEKGGSV